jgi:hypothetical protein
MHQRNQKGVNIMMDDLLKALMSGAGSQQGGGQADDDPLADMLGGLMGGGTDSGGADAGDLLEAFMGGGSSQGAGGMGDLLGALMGGGGGANTGTSALLAPMTDALAKKLGLPPEMAQMVVTFVVTQLLSGKRGGASGGGQGGFDLDDLMVRAASNEGLDVDYIQSTGMADELAEQTGRDSDTAARSLQETLQMMGGVQGSQSQDPSAGPGLDDLLENW